MVYDECAHVDLTASDRANGRGMCLLFFKGDSMNDDQPRTASKYKNVTPTKLKLPIEDNEDFANSVKLSLPLYCVVLNLELCPGSDTFYYNNIILMPKTFMQINIGTRPGA